MNRRRFLLSTALASLATLAAPLVGVVRSWRRNDLADRIYNISPEEPPFSYRFEQQPVQIYHAEPVLLEDAEAASRAVAQMERRTQEMLDDIYRRSL